MTEYNINMSAHTLCRDYAKQLASLYGLDFDNKAPKSDFRLYCNPERLELQDLRPNAPGPISVDFASGKANFRRYHGGGRNQTLAKAIGIKKNVVLHIIDATAGMGQDAFVLASLGCHLTLIERSPVFAALLADGLERARLNIELNDIIQNMTLEHANSCEFLEKLQAPNLPEVVYMDPMYPQRRKSALVKKEMRYARALLGDDSEAPELLAISLLTATKRVVVKRPKSAPALIGPKPGLSISSKNTRYDIYLTKNQNY